MNKVLFILFAATCSLNVLAAEPTTAPIPPTAVVYKVIGQVLFDGKNLQTGDVIDKNGQLETKEKSLIQIKIAKWNNSISVGPATKMMLDLAGEKKYTLEQGICRWKTEV